MLDTNEVKLSGRSVKEREIKRERGDVSSANCVVFGRTDLLLFQIQYFFAWTLIFWVRLSKPLLEQPILSQLLRLFVSLELKRAELCVDTIGEIF